MATTPTQLFRGPATTTSSELYKRTDGKTTVVSSIIVANNSGADQTFTLAFAGVAAFTTVTVAKGTSVLITDVRQVIASGEAITGLASATSVAFHISGSVY